MLMNLLFSPVLSAVTHRTATGGIIYYVLAAILAITVLIGISMMSKVRTAVRGNLLGSVSMLLMIVLTLWYWNIFSFVELYISMLLGAAIGIWLSVKVNMIQMPQMVGILNGFGGAASMLAGILTLIAAGDGSSADLFSLATSGLAIFVGAFTFTGSMVAGGKLHGVITQKPIEFKRHALWTALALVASLLTVVLLSIPAVLAVTVAKTILIILCSILSGLFGIIFAIRVGGADMPITISLLNSFSGVAGAIAGLAIADPLLVSVGAIVGASGLLLTQIMCRSMNRKLMDILLGKTSTPQVKAKQKNTATAAAGAEVKAAAGKAVISDAAQAGPAYATWLKDAEKIIIVPGYGMALSQAQPLVKNLMDELEDAGKNVEFAIHPVAGRMPGHMNVLLAEVDVPYEKLHEMEEINPRFAETDVVIVIGANDVVNPAANTAAGTPIYGMPVLDVEDAKHVIIMNYDKLPGYAGVDNPLYEESRGDKIALLLGDAKESLKTLVKEYRAGIRPAEEKVKTADSGPAYATWLKDAEKIIIVPGYGMALSQAQPLVKNLMDELEAAGKNVEFAIHPVAGRMPGHMNVLLAEVDVPYEKLHEMEEINPRFAETDVVIIIGANDVVNPAANTAAGTPIYGMPVLDVEDAKHVIIMNYDKLPGYAGVDNPLYEEGRSDKIALLLGDATASLKNLLQDLREYCG